METTMPVTRRDPHTFQLARLPTPVGTMLIVTDEQERLRVLDWEEDPARLQRQLDRYYGTASVRLTDAPARSPVRDALAGYVAGDLSAIDPLITETPGTAFQREVWAALRQIPAGETWSYGRLAAHIARPAAVRAVGLANGANPICIVVPCHRVIGADGTLTGYGGGIARKRWLLTHEGARFRE